MADTKNQKGLWRATRKSNDKDETGKLVLKPGDEFEIINIHDGDPHGTYADINFNGIVHKNQLLSYIETIATQKLD